MITLVFFAQTREFWVGFSIFCAVILVVYYLATKDYNK